VEIIDISEQYVPTYCKCLEEWSGEMKDSGTLKERWYEAAKGQGLRVKLARNDKGDIVGMIHYTPSEHAPIHAESLYYVYCIWVHGYKEGVGDFQKRGIGKQLLRAAEEDAMALGAKGIAAWGLTLPFFMRSKWFKKNGYRHADKDGMIELVWKPFADDAQPPRLLKQRKKPELAKDRTTITCFRNGWCTAQNIAYERMKRVAEEYKDRVAFVDIDTSERETMEEWGISDAVFVDLKQVRTGPPPTYEKLKRIVGRRIKT
jgi:GNAT superfamily N-acetyltransferase